MTPSFNSQFVCPHGDEDPPNSASTRPVERGGNRTTASTPGGPATEPPTDPHTPSHTALKPPTCRSEDEARTPAPVLARTGGLFGEGKDQGSVKRRMAATGTMAANVSVPNSASRPDRGDHSATSIFKSARSSAMSSLNRFTGGGAKKGPAGETPSRGGRDAENPRGGSGEVVRDLRAKIDGLETENDSLKKEAETLKTELIRRARVIAQMVEQNAKLSQDVAQVTSLKQPREINWTYRARDTSLGGDAGGDADFDGTPSSKARRASNDFKFPRRRGLSLTRTSGPGGEEDELKSLKQRLSDLVLEQAKLTSTNDALRNMVTEAESLIEKREQRAEEARREVQKLEDQLESQGARLQELETKIANAQVQLEDIHQQHQSKTESLSTMEKDRVNLKAESDKLRNEQESLQASTADLLAKKDALVKSQSDLEKSLKEKDEEFKKKIADFEANYGGESLNMAIQKVKELESDITIKSEHVTELAARLTKLEGDISSQTNKLEEIKEEISVNDKKKDEALATRAAVEKELNDLTSSVAVKRADEEKLVKNMEHAQELVVKAQQELTRLEKTEVDLKSKIDSLQTTSKEVDEARAKLTELKTEYSTLTETMAKEKATFDAEIGRLKSESDSLEAKIRTTQSTIDKLTKDEATIQLSKQQLQKDVSELQATLDVLRKQRDQFTDDFQQMEKDRQRLDSQKSSLQTEINSLNAKLGEKKDIQRVETTDSKSKRSVSTIPGSTDRSEASERSDDFRGVPVESVETFLSAPEELNRVKNEVLKLTNVLALRREELTSTERSLEDLHLRRQQESMACDKLRDSVKQLEELRQTRESEFRSLTDKCDELTRQIEELRATESAMGHDRSRTSSRGLSLEKDDIIRGLHLKDDCWFGPDKSPSLANLVPEPDVSPDASRMAMALETHMFNLREVHKERDALRDVIVHLEKQKFSLIETIKTLQEEVDDAHTNLSLLRTEIAEGTSKLASLRSDLASATAALQMIRDEHANSKKLLAVSNETRDKCDSEVNAFRSSLSTLRRERDQLQRTIEQLRDERTKLEDEVAAQTQRKVIEETRSSASTKETELMLSHLEDEVRRMREAASSERMELAEKIDAARDEFSTLNDQIKQRQMDEQARMARVEEDRVRSRQHFEAAMKEAEAELKSLQNQVVSARSSVRDEMEAETRAIRAQKETELRDLQAKIAECENHYKQIRAKVRSQVKLVGRSSLDWVRQAAEHVVAEVILDDIDGLEQDNTSAVRLEAKVLDKIRTLQAERAAALSPSSGQPPWASPLSPATHPRFHPGSPVWQRSVEWQGRRASHDGRHPLALFEQRASVQTSPPPAVNNCGGDSVTQNSTQESFVPAEGFVVKDGLFPAMDAEETARLLADNAALRSQVMHLHRRLGDATETTDTR